MPKKRKSLKREYAKQIFIRCEGKETEPNYLRKFVRECGLDNKKVKVQITDTEYTSAVQLIDEVVGDRESENDELWVVYDKDGYTKHAEAYVNARDKGVNIAFSSISFEFWILLHFKYTTKCFAKSKQLEKQLEKGGYFSEYRKGDVNIFDKIFGQTQIAITNAKRVRKHHTKSSNDKMYKLNPYTNVDELLHAIENLRKEYLKNPEFLFKY